MTFEWWMWIVGGITLIIAELAIPAFFVIWFGLGALLVGLLMLLFPELSATAQVATWTLASLALVILWFKVFKQSFQKTRIGTADGEVIGEVGLLVGAVAPFARGKVRFQRPLLGSEEWACIADAAIAAGERVRVVAVEGSFLKVSKA
ncbi:NfeD family protein [Quatrionicoccus australiensis]|uniref:NfeD family protein n=1 Tax=Quatrionicoccus australiensis TaxID=138118 RepID=UPI001CF8DF06|nr:NfeD family protein [Quatrionicoccus australiensis]UCV15367.1 NfeD family protein [Quatrionicoccus australiensis]